MTDTIGYSALKDLTRMRDAKTRRVSSWDRTGGNRDYVSIAQGEVRDLADIHGAGCITHMWVCPGWDVGDKYWLRGLLLRIFWDDEDQPSVETPLGDFFGVGHAIAKSYAGWPVNMVVGSKWVPGEGQPVAMNCYFQMPFAMRARVQLVNECTADVPLCYYHVDYELYEDLGPDVLRFHAQWRRENPTDGINARGGDLSKLGEDDFWAMPNLSGEGNYVILEAEGRGHYVGCNLSVDNLDVGERAPMIGGAPNEWWGDGGDMIFVDGDEWPPTLHGTGSEDYFNFAHGMRNLAYPYSGSSLEEWRETFPHGRKLTAYRYHIEDPVVFHKSIRVTIEHGHANIQSNDYSSVAYWYQTEPHKPFPSILPREQRLPRPHYGGAWRGAYWDSMG